MCPQTPNFDRETKRDSGVKPTNHSSVYLGVNSCVHRHMNSPVYTYSYSERHTWIRLFSLSHILTQPHMKVKRKQKWKNEKNLMHSQKATNKTPMGPKQREGFHWLVTACAWGYQKGGTKDWKERKKLWLLFAVFLTCDLGSWGLLGLTLYSELDPEKSGRTKMCPHMRTSWGSIVASQGWLGNLLQCNL